MELLVTRLTPHAILPSYATEGAAAFDLAASEDVVVPPRAIRLVPTGLVVQVPAGHFLGVFARSSTPLKRGLMVANGVGVVDPDYCGPEDELKIMVFNFTEAEVAVRRGDRIAQGMVMTAPRVVWRESGGPGGRSRGGFGATGD